jgi:rhodanese-related sulfurtransferase
MLAVFCLLLVLGCGTPEEMGSLAPATPVGVASPVAAGSPTQAPTSAAQPSEGNTGLVPGTLASVELLSWQREGRTPVLVDVRAKWLCDQDRIPGALCIPTGELEARLPDLPRDGEIVVYGGGYGDADATEVRAGAQLLLKKGFTKVYELQDGLAGYAIVTLPSCGCKP